MKTVKTVRRPVQRDGAPPPAAERTKAPSSTAAGKAAKPKKKGGSKSPGEATEAADDEGPDAKADEEYVKKGRIPSLALMSDEDEGGKGKDKKAGGAVGGADSELFDEGSLRGGGVDAFGALFSPPVTAPASIFKDRQVGFASIRLTHRRHCQGPAAPLPSTTQRAALLAVN